MRAFRLLHGWELWSIDVTWITNVGEVNSLLHWRGQEATPHEQGANSQHPEWWAHPEQDSPVITCGLVCLTPQLWVAEKLLCLRLENAAAMPPVHWAPGYSSIHNTLIFI